MDAEQSKQIEMLYFELFDRLMAYAQSCLNNALLAEEAVQETFRIACQRPESLCVSPNPQGWLILTLKNTIRNMDRTRAATKRLLERYVLTQTGKVQFAEDGIKIDILYENIVDSEDFKLLSELAIEGISHREMASKRGISVSACKKRVQRAKEVLQKKIK